MYANFNHDLDEVTGLQCPWETEWMECDQPNGGTTFTTAREFAEHMVNDHQPWHLAVMIGQGLIKLESLEERINAALNTYPDVESPARKWFPHYYVDDADQGAYNPITGEEPPPVGREPNK